VGGCPLHPEVTAGVSGAAHAYGMQVEDIRLEEAAGHQLLKPGPDLSLLHFALFHRSPSFIILGDSYCNTIDMAYNNYNSDDIQ